MTKSIKNFTQLKKLEVCHCALQSYKISQHTMGYMTLYNINAIQIYPHKKILHTQDDSKIYAQTGR